MQRYVDGLLRRGLYESAIRFCDLELQKTNDGEEQTGEADFLAAEKVRVLTSYAISLTSPQREPVLLQLEQWQQQWHRQWEAKENKSTKSFADAFQFPYQLAVSDWKLGDSYRREEATAASKAAEGNEKRSVFFLDRAVERLAQLRKAVDERMADRTIPPAKAQELLAIQQQIDFQTALVWRSLALGFERESDEQLECLHRALQGLTPLAALGGTGPILVQCRLEKAVCLRLLHELDAAEETLNSVLKPRETLSEIERIQAFAEGIRLALAQGKVEQAIRLSEIEPHDANPDFDLARLEAYLSRWKLASKADQEQSKPLLDRVLEFSRRMERLHGPYWSRRAQMLVAECMKSETPGEFGVYVKLAENAFHQEQFDDAVRYYDLSSAAAEQSGDAASAFRFALIAASVESRAEHDQAAQKRLRDAAIQWADQEQAPDAYLFGLEQLQNSVENKESPSADFTAGLVEFAKTWPQSPHHGEIARKAAVLLEKEGQYRQAFEICPEFEGRTKTICDIQQQISQGRKEEALRKAADLWKKNALDPEIARFYGDLLAASDPKGGLDFWRDLEKSFENLGRARTEDEDEFYWKTKETIIRLHLQLGNRQQAKKLLDLIRLLHPEQSERFKDL